VQKTAGAKGVAISRDYRNTQTGERVGLWLIVGHARDISAHTPDVCYPASGFEIRARENSLYPIVVPGLPDAPFWTNTFYKEDRLTGRTLNRVFWAWFNPEADENEGKVAWEAPSNARWRFGNTRALYKMYFTSDMHDQTETAEQSPCVHFARDFLPVVDKVLSEVHHMPVSGGEVTASEQQTTATPAAAPASDPATTEANAGETDAATTEAEAAAPAADFAAEKPVDAAAPAKSE
jgi:hypothetical protein